MPKDPAEVVTQYPPERIWQLLTANSQPDVPNHAFHANASRKALIHAYNVAPESVDGILLAAVGAGDNMTLAINDIGTKYPDIRLGTSDIHIHGYDTFRLSAEQEAQRKRFSLRQRLGEIAVTATIVDGTIFEATGHWLPDSLIFGAFATGIVYGAGRPLISRLQRGRATKALQAFNNWAVQPENGAIVFPRHYPSGDSRRESISITVSLMPTEDECALLSWARNFRALEAKDRSKDDTKVCTIIPSQLTEELLRYDQAPSEVWTNGFAERERTLADTDRQLIAAEQALMRAEDRSAFTGHPLDGELEKLEQSIVGHKQTLLRTSLEMIRQIKEHTEAYLQAQRAEKAAALIDEVGGGMVEEPHSLELHLQTLHGFANTALAQFDLEHSTTHTIALAVNKYLKGTRARLNDHSQIKQFYEGLRDIFKRHSTYELPEWEAVADQFPATLYTD